MNEEPYAAAIRIRQAINQGHSPKSLRGSGWKSAGHGVVIPSGAELDPVLRRITVPTALLTNFCAIGGWAALYLQGNTWFAGVSLDGRERPVLVHCSPGSQLRKRPGLQPFRGNVYADELISLGGHDVTSLARAAYDEMRMARDIGESVVALDMAISTTTELPRTRLEAIRRVIESHRKTRGLAQARRALEFASSRSASPWETRTRLLATFGAGIPQLLVNAPLFDRDGNLLGIADLLDPDSGLIIESDGGHHREEVRHTDDNRREEKFERAGLVVCRVTALDHHERDATIQRISAARMDAFAATKRAWTLDKPAWWWTWPPARRWD